MAAMRKSDGGIHERRSVARGAIIIREGERGDTAYLIQSGQVQIYTGKQGRRVKLATLGPGQIFGEMALLFDEERTATVEALDPCTFVIITRDILKKKVDKSDPTVRAILPMLMTRIVQTNNVLLKNQSSLDELVETVTVIYQNIHATLPAAQKKSLENDVLPKLDELLNEVKAFRDRYYAGS
jgi:CRP/FNR family transcriptional regulator, cyclic AMP receptor protein